MDKPASFMDAIRPPEQKLSHTKARPVMAAIDRAEGGRLPSAGSFRWQKSNFSTKSHHQPQASKHPVWGNVNAYIPHKKVKSVRKRVVTSTKPKAKEKERGYVHDGVLYADAAHRHRIRRLRPAKETTNNTFGTLAESLKRTLRLERAIAAKA